MNSNERRLNAGKYTVEQYDEFARYENSSILVTFNLLESLLNFRYFRRIILSPVWKYLPRPRILIQGELKTFLKDF